MDEQTQILLRQLEQYHDALDWALAQLVFYRPGFLPSKSPAWPAMVSGQALIKELRGRPHA
jgi:hypothetical protein